MNKYSAIKEYCINYMDSDELVFTHGVIYNVVNKKCHRCKVQ